MKKLIFLMLMSVWGIGMVQAQSTAYTYVKQNGTYVSADGTAAFDVSSKAAVMSFDDDDNAIMTIDGVTVAKIRANERNIDLTDDATAGPLAKGILAAAFNNQSGSTNPGQLQATVTSNGYATLYSPFQLQMPSASNKTVVYAPKLTDNVLKCNAATVVRPDGNPILPVCTTLLLKNEGSINFTISSAASTNTQTSVLEGYAVTMPLPEVAEGKIIYTLGHEKKDASKFGFFKYVNKETLAAAKAFLVAPTLDDYLPDDGTANAKYIHFDFTDNTATAISNVKSNVDFNGKYVENGKVVIVKNGQKYNIAGQEVK